MAEIAFDLQAIDFAALATWARTGLFGRLAAPGGLPGYPALDAQRPVASGSPWLDRRAAAAAIAAQNPGLPAPDPEADYVIAGQQAALLTGPLYAVLKAVSAVALARDLTSWTGRPHLPLYWIAAEDHDVLEVNRVTVNGRRFVHEAAGPVARGRMPQVADIDLRAAQAPLLEFLRAELPATEFTPWILDQVNRADFRSYVTAFADLMRALFARWELRLVDPIGLRPLTGPVLAAAVAAGPEARAALATGADRLRAAGVDPPLPAEPRLFEISGGHRVALDVEPDGLRRGGRLLGWAEAAAAIRAHPERFSAGAALRPICQDGALPIAVTLGGPAELAYLWQVAPLAEALGVRSSARHPRVSATFVGASTARAAQAAGLEGIQIFAAAEMLRVPGSQEQPDERAREIERRTGELLAALDALEMPGDPRWLRAGRDAIASAGQRVVARLAEEQRAAAGRSRERLEKIAAAVLPEGRLQERVVNVFQFVNLYGPDFVDAAVARLDPCRSHHHLVRIRTA